MKPEFLGWLQAIQIVFTIGLAVYTWRINREAARTSRVKALEVADAMQEQKIALLQQRIDSMPCDSQCQTFETLRSDVAVLNERTKNFDAWLNRMSNIVDRMDQWMRDNK
jgi:hypothetical protein